MSTAESEDTEAKENIETKENTETKEDSIDITDESDGADDIALPSWWVSSSAEDVVDKGNTADAGDTENIDGTDGANDTADIEEETDTVVISDMTGADLLAGTEDESVLPGVSSDEVAMPDFQVPEDLLRSTLKSVEEEEDDDDAWTPRPVRQIRL